MISRSAPLDLTLGLIPFRRRIAFVRAWKYAAVGGSLASIIFCIATVGDRLDYWDASPMLLAGILAAGMVVGASFGAAGRYKPSQVAASIDRRAQLDDRLSTIAQLKEEKSAAQIDFIEAVKRETSTHLTALDPKLIYPLRNGLPQAVFAFALFICTLLYLLLETPILVPLSSRYDIAQMKRGAQQVEVVAKPWLEQASGGAASNEDKALAANLRHLIHDLDKGRLTKQEALIRANQLAEQAQSLQQQHSQDFTRSLNSAETAREQLQQMASSHQLKQGSASDLQQKASSLQRQITDLQKQLDSAQRSRSKLSQLQIAALSSKLAALQNQLQQIQISQRAAEMLAELASDPKYQQAMALLSKLQQAQSSSSSGQSAMSPEQMQQAANQLDQLAKELNTDAKMKAYARALREAAKVAREGQEGQMAAALNQAFGLKNNEYSGAPNDYGQNGSGSTAPGTWVGDNGHLNQGKSTLLNLKYEDKYVSSQKGTGGSETYSDELGPARLDAKSGIPYQLMLPKYEKSAESALATGDVAPEMRTNVKNYFDSLHPTQ